MKLELKHLAPYCPYGLKVILGTTIRNLTAISLDSPFVFVTAWIGSREKQMAGVENIKPILRPLSDLTKEIEHNGVKVNVFNEIEIYKGSGVDYLIEQIRLGFVEVVVFNMLLKYHFDVFGLIPAGLAIDINTL